MTQNWNKKKAAHNAPPLLSGNWTYPLFKADKSNYFAVGAVMAVSRKLLAIIGPTESGKSDLAMEIARKSGAQILGADSMQVYRGMNIGTAKPSAEQRAEVVHHLIDVVEPSETFTVARFVEMADEVIARAKVPLIVVGGTPLYYKALFEGLF